MIKDEVLQCLYKKLDDNYKDFVAKWLDMEPTMLIQLAEEIAATKTSYDVLKSGCLSSDFLEYLLRFDNPLEVVRDQWIEEQNLPLEDDMNHALWALSDERDAERRYALDKDYVPPAQSPMM